MKYFYNSLHDVLQMKLGFVILNTRGLHLKGYLFNDTIPKTDGPSVYPSSSVLQIPIVENEKLFNESGRINGYRIEPILLESIIEVKFLGL